MEDLILRSGSPLGRLFKAYRFSDVCDELDKLWKQWDIDIKSFADLQPKSTFPKVNVMETCDNYVVEIALAGFNKEDIDIELKDNCLRIKADKKEESVEDKKYLMKEISSRSFRRVINFPSKIVAESVSCTNKDGLVTCVFEKEKLKEIKDDIIKIKIN